MNTVLSNSEETKHKGPIFGPICKPSDGSIPTKSVNKPIYGPICGSYSPYFPYSISFSPPEHYNPSGDRSADKFTFGDRNADKFTFGDRNADKFTFGVHLTKGIILPDLPVVTSTILPLTPNASVVLFLKLNEGKYYIEKVRNYTKRLQEHKERMGCKWTSLYPLDTDSVKDGIIKIFECESSEDVNRYVKEYMKIYGIENVRGGVYSSVQLPEVQIRSLKKELAGTSLQSRRIIKSDTFKSKKGCFKCREDGHYSKDCRTIIV